MNFFNVYVNIVRVLLVIAFIYYIYKHNLKLARFVGIVLILTFLTLLLDSVFDIKIDAVGSVLYITIILMGIYLGSGLKFYDKFPWWDLVLHFIAGISFVSFGVAFAQKADDLSKFAILFFSLTFSVFLHTLWEITEYLVDRFSKSDHQRWQKASSSRNHISEKAVQPAGLVDTMHDTIACMVGAILACAVWWFVL
ncbi:MAG: hypothetical protein FWC68_04830 [Oscillospiraceae bacterium]|nr:hypothetical protein [Oscillospiraceae bacterium]